MQSLHIDPKHLTEEENKHERDVLEHLATELRICTERVAEIELLVETQTILATAGLRCDTAPALASRLSHYESRLKRFSELVLTDKQNATYTRCIQTVILLAGHLRELIQRNRTDLPASVPQPRSQRHRTHSPPRVHTQTRTTSPKRVDEPLKSNVDGVNLSQTDTDGKTKMAESSAETESESISEPTLTRLITPEPTKNVYADQ